VKTATRALSLVFAVDISRSMLAEDVAPSRLQRAGREARRLIQDLEGDRLGLIAFAGRSYILAPLTVDGGAVRMYLDALDPDLASEGGTSLNAVLAQGTELLGAATDAADRVLVVFTDGEAHDTLPEVVARAEALKDAGVRLVVVAEGRALPTRIPIRDSAGTLTEYKQDEDGNVVRTQRRDDVLRAMVDAAEGTLVPNELPDQAGAVRDLVAAMKRTPTAETRTADLVPRAWIPALCAALLLAGYTLARPGPALIGLAGLLLGGSAHAQRPTPGTRAMAEGDPARAAAEFLKDAGGRARDTAFYNAGTAALEARRYDVARGALEQAAKSLDPDLRYRALYNLGVLNLLVAQADTTKAEELLGEASDRLREALRLQPSSPRAKWNLELAERRRPPPPSNAGGGGGGKPPSGGGQPPPPPPSGSEQPSQGLSQSQAEQILSSMERRERQTREEQQRRLRAGSAGGVKDW
jgi:Ca-activated chloride channel family protein